MIARISIDLQNAVEAFEDAFGMSAATSGRVMIDDDRRIGSGMAAIVAHDGPQVTGLGPAPAR